MCHCLKSVIFLVADHLGDVCKSFVLYLLYSYGPPFFFLGYDRLKLLKHSGTQDGLLDFAAPRHAKAHPKQ